MLQVAGAGIVSPRKWRNEDNPDWEMLHAEVVGAITGYTDWMERVARDPNAEATPLLMMVGEALIALSEHLGMSVHIYGE